MRAREVAFGLAVALVVATAGCQGCGAVTSAHRDAGPGVAGDALDPAEPLLADLEKDEAAWRASTDWATFPASDTTLGPDPYDIVALGDGRFAGVLRGANAVVLLDAAGRELARAPTARAPRFLSVDGEHLVIGSELGSPLAKVRIDGLTPVDGASGIGRAIAPDAVPFVIPRLAGEWLAVMSVLGHRVVVVQLGAEDNERERDRAPLAAALRTVRDDSNMAIVSNGAVLGFALRPIGDEVLVAVGMIEDHPLDRTGGSFGFIDSFLRVMRVSKTSDVRELLEVNLSEHGIVTPKALAFPDDDTVLVAGSGSGRAARVTLSTGAVAIVPSLPGVVALVPTAHGFIGASPLLDAWVVVDESGARAVPVPLGEGAPSRARTVDSKLGEALVFTTIMAPRQKSDGPLSRFTCEACHFEGTIDGRTHDTGRMAATEHVRATTRPLWGLFNNKPLFTRAMDANLSRMVHAEFRVANANSALDPWFALTPADAAWLSLLGVQGTRSPIELRRALVAFLRDFTPRTNPHVARRMGDARAFSDLERRGAEVFRTRCASCHAARLVGDDAATDQPFEKWEALVLSDNGPLVWSSPEHRKTGVEPYVHEEGARASSLRRVWMRSPLFTNGAAPTLDDALDRARLDGETFLHSSNRELPGLTADEKRALLAFLLLL